MPDDVDAVDASRIEQTDGILGVLRHTEWARQVTRSAATPEVGRDDHP
jgi:hypothetical protein